MKYNLTGFIALSLFFNSLAYAKNELTKSEDITLQVSQYINSTWTTLTRNSNSFVDGHTDPKLPNAKTILYVPQEEDINKIKAIVAKATPPTVMEHIQITDLPKDVTQIKEHGLLYLPYPYVVPGGRFNEMYGWDSYFIELGLLADNHVGMAKNMVENIIYEVMHYGTILNANRTYYLQRSQPPFLTEMILAYYKKTKDKAWLKSTLPAINKLYQFWQTSPHYIPSIGLSRYYAGGQGATPEESPLYYQKALEYYKTHEIGDYDKSLYYDEKANKLTDRFYIADRSVRESGFDITAKFGPFGAAILDYAPVDLNVLLYKHEKQAGEIYAMLGDQVTAAKWNKRAEERANKINKYMWNESLGYYFDYNFKRHRLRPYVYATTFYPLWAGIASKDQADAVVSNLPNLLAAGGIVTSTYRPKLQWDAPFGWAPMQYFAVKGLNHYGYKDLAKEVASRFVNTVNVGYKQAHTLFEKYDVQTISTSTGDKIGFSYSTNETGFGWTNGVYLIFTDFLKETTEVVTANAPIAKVA